MSSLRTLAKSLGLSITTVSRALDNYADVSQATRARVRAAAEAAGYRPNAAARRLRKGSTEMVTMVLPTEPGQFNEPLYIELLAALGKRLASDGYDLTLLASPPGTEEIKTYRRLVEGRRTDGLIVVRTRRDDARVRWLLDADFPFVTMGRTDVAGDFAFVDGDGEAAFREATQRLIALGHRRIALVGAPTAFTFATLRRAGYRAAMAAAGLEPIELEVAADEEGGHAGASALLQAAGRPTALLCATDRIAYGALRAARRLGLSVPADLSVVGHDNLPASAFSDPPLTTMELPIAETGDLLADMLLARIGGADPRTLRRICPVRFVERQSTAPPP
jgi:LacI family transcriptional regulator